MYKIYSRHRIKVPNFFIRFGEKFKQKKNRKILKIIIILIIAFSTLKVILDAIMPIFEVLCKDKAKSMATIVSNEQATNVMAEHSYDEIFTIEKDNNEDIFIVDFIYRSFKVVCIFIEKRKLFHSVYFIQI